jgi:S-adenosylmethionine:tRNA ribosyltransferase-isomerase
VVCGQRDANNRETMLVTDFDFDLPTELIAQEAVPRGESRLLVLDRRTGALAHTHIAELPAFLRPGDLLVVNDTRVFPARLLGHRVPTGAAVECLLLERLPPPEAERRTPNAERRTKNEFWSALMHPGQKLKPGALVRFSGPAGVLMGEVIDRHYFGRRTIQLWADSGGEVETLVDALGHVPLPPYIKRADTLADRDRYQTTFARVRGSIAAPTAGLHFTPEILASLERAGVARAAVTLHVGYGTFKPVRSADVESHVVDPERYQIDAATAGTIARARAEGRRVIAVGTTTTRALEDAAIRGGGVVEPIAAEATTFIHPGFRFQAIDGLLTNFHLPKSSLLMLVAAFGGRERVLAAYREAVEQRYRFYSYGDAMLIV